MFNEWEIPLNIWTHYLPPTSHPILRWLHHLSRQSEGKGEHFALDVVAEAIAVFDGPHTTLLGHADVENLKPLVLHCLLIAAYSDVSVNHILVVWGE